MKKNFNIKKFDKFVGLIDELSPSLNKNSIKLLEWVLEELLSRRQLLVTEYINYCICPRCYAALNREYILYCDRCGQSLKWGSMKKLKYVSYEEIQKRLEIQAKPKIEVDKEVDNSGKTVNNPVKPISVDEIIEYLNTSKSNIMNDKKVISCFSMILTTLSEQIKKG